uniref:Endoplasmic reticulum vesicle transporter C-terminal domain-containing protein n=2 Tax=Pyramimonas obovata TaxID=1411642 RepID=A0A7S0MQW3_9CHLO|mmetsp:Transcript_11212/g.23384  ORF Transcript_11212/g.23384 Transcript_11212/m.23384 type:complete len:386 (+) Transcript_11212:195-1352(+)|eukprot:CAMPEP_0118923136 /NCGR_PEP_ID=MMETSP1169-20130426/1775_1 /TAXON_ID=36882 /ORGANISM="Pyramimonas obovata, Strain CCMP722" /LENGTH=385 /DNA_ID=CAMNT_0006864081 /DNA_START=168 /DNA_END=1325 /DNA_ORIENTATION=+
MDRLKRLDVYPKINEDFFTRTFTGGIITIISSVVMLLLFFSEFWLYLSYQTTNELNVDTSRGEKLQINIDVTFYNMGCAIISLDAMDISGEQHLDVLTNVFKRRLDANLMPVEDSHVEKSKLGGDQLLDLITNKGEVHDKNKTEEYCGSCYGAEEREEDCCNTCDQVREAYRRRGWAFMNSEHIAQCKNDDYLGKIKEQEGEACNVYGYLEVNKVAGNFHFAPGKSFQQGHMHVHDLMPFDNVAFNVSHTINKLSFGADFPGVVNPMDGIDRYMEADTGMYQYFIKVVPTTYQTSRGNVIETNQFSVTEHFKSADGQGKLPGVFFFYDLSPIKVTFREERSSFLKFITSLCAIIGGVFTVSGIFDSFVYHGQKAIKKKLELGKQT